MGVLLAVSGTGKFSNPEDRDHSIFTIYKKNLPDVPVGYRKLSSMIPPCAEQLYGVNKFHQRHVVSMNDSDHSFEEIADYIEAYI